MVPREERLETNFGFTVTRRSELVPARMELHKFLRIRAMNHASVLVGVVLSWFKGGGKSDVADA